MWKETKVLGVLLPLVFISAGKKLKFRNKVGLGTFFQWAYKHFTEGQAQWKKIHNGGWGENVHKQFSSYDKLLAMFHICKSANLGKIVYYDKKD